MGRNKNGFIFAKGPLDYGEPSIVTLQLGCKAEHVKVLLR